MNKFDPSDPDHRNWAAEFCRIAREKGFDPSNPDHEEWLGTWFANAMMNGYDRAAVRYSEVSQIGEQGRTA